MQTPNAKHFNKHFIVHPALSAAYYDPSYGIKAEDTTSYTPSAIGAWSADFGSEGTLWAPQEEHPQRVLEAVDLRP